MTTPPPPCSQMGFTRGGGGGSLTPRCRHFHGLSLHPPLLHSDGHGDGNTTPVCGGAALFLLQGLFDYFFLIFICSVYEVFLTCLSKMGFLIFK